jgi:ZIP family zinc transporter
MANVLKDIMLYSLSPVLAAILGAIVSAMRSPPPALRSAIQHFAAGVVFPVVAVELLPDIQQPEVRRRAQNSSRA